jgi:hypothetical protein
MSSLYFYVFKGDKPHSLIMHTKHSILNLTFISDLVCFESSLLSPFAFLCHRMGTGFKSGTLNVNHYDQPENTL